MKILQKIGDSIYIYILQVFPLFANAQLINNGNFESHSTIPTDISQLGYCNNWTNGGSLLSTPDYYHTLCPTANFCPITPLNVKVPTNILGTQSDHSLLSAYVGIVTYDYALRDYRDYIQTPTVDATLHTPKPLTPGSDYAVTFQYSNADNAYFASDIGVMLTAGAINLATASPYRPGTIPYPYFRTDKPSVPTPANYKTDWYTFSETFHLRCETNIDHLAIGNFQQNGIWFHDCLPANLECNYNVPIHAIEDVSLLTTGINLEQSTLVSCPNKEIAYNVIHAAKLGIEIFNHPNLVKVHDNEVDNRLITNTYRCTGIAAVNSSYFQIYCN